MLLIVKAYVITVLWITVIIVFFEAQKLLWLFYWWRSFVSKTIWTMKQFLGTPCYLSRQNLILIFKKQWCIGFITGNILTKFKDQCTVNLVAWDQQINRIIFREISLKVFLVALRTLLPSAVVLWNFDSVVWLKYCVRRRAYLREFLFWRWCFKVS